MPAVDKYLLLKYIQHRDLDKLDNLLSVGDLTTLANDMNWIFEHKLDKNQMFRPHSGAEYKHRILKLAFVHKAAPTEKVSLRRGRRSIYGDHQHDGGRSC